ncbi:DUF1616 domain-containing protein [Haloarcula brevis]|uniref:DUF1616 domain-containing protein n=1 Tax=Haloarcula brevis TaxID=3111453 RepID=UPI00300F4793
MASWSSSLLRVADLVAVILLTVLALAATFLSESLLRTVVTIPFLFFAPGYSVVVAMFPHRRSSLDGEQLFGSEALLLGIATSIGLAIIVGVNLEYTVWDIAAVPVMVALSSISLLAVGIAMYRRLSTLSETSPTTFGGSSYRAKTPNIGDSIQLSSVVVAVAVLVAVLSVGAVALDPPRGERYTEFGLLTEAENGTLVADDYPSEISAGDRETLYFTVTNREMQNKQYTVVVTLVATNEDGNAIQRARLDSFSNQVAAEETWRQEHTVEPLLSGERLRLTYLLYDGPVPEQPTAQNSYRNLHLWLTVS